VSAQRPVPPPADKLVCELELSAKTTTIGRVKDRIRKEAWSNLKVVRSAVEQMKLEYGTSELADDILRFGRIISSMEAVGAVPEETELFSIKDDKITFKEIHTNKSSAVVEQDSMPLLTHIDIID
jgi:hypothetical protein